MTNSAIADNSSPITTDRDRALSGCKTLSVGGADGWEPITYIEENGRQSGLGIDILRAYADAHGIQLELRLDVPWNRSLQMLAKNELDVIAGAYFTAERDRTFIYTQPFAYDDVMIFQHRDNRFAVNGLHDLIGYRGARPQGGSYGDHIDKFAEQRLDMMYSPTGNNIFKVLLNGRADYVMLGLYDGMANIYRDKLVDTVIPAETPIARNEVHLMFSRGSACVRHIKNINILIDRLDEDGTLDQWTKNHLMKYPTENGS
ncbi:amino acid-binding protein [Thalassospira profundimaris]|uniref:Amino acid-binding protein n=1 Tax=Thalassospira profundimaris TaxID=502049 RepID=A0A367W8I6_9PROT|nr:amino acid-binding protein [Thalassospira profundimaris]